MQAKATSRSFREPAGPDTWKDQSSASIPRRGLMAAGAWPSGSPRPSRTASSLGPGVLAIVGRWLRPGSRGSALSADRAERQRHEAGPAADRPISRRSSRSSQPVTGQRRPQPQASPSPSNAGLKAVSDELGSSRLGEQLPTPLLLSSQHRETLCSGLGLGLKVAVALVAGVSLVRLAGAYQERMEHHAELRAVLTVQSAKLEKARTRFDQLFAIGGEQTLIRQQGQWIAPNRLRVVWNR